MKKNLFVINENERSRILNMHKTATKNNYVFEQEEPIQYYKDAQGKVIKLTGYKSPPLGSEPATASEYLDQNPTQNQGTEQKTVVSGRYTTMTCAGKKPNCQENVLKIQTRMNDECPAEILTTKLVEDGLVGPKTINAWKMCKPKLTPTKKIHGVGAKPESVVSNVGDVKTQEPKAEPLTVDEHATYFK
jgi:hypothetical protein